MTHIPNQWTVGENLVRFEPPDLIRVKYRGPCTLRVAIQMLDVCRELGRVRPFFMVGDLEEAGTMDSEARRYFNEHFQTEWLLGLISYKARLIHRALITGMRLALELTRDEARPLLDKVHFVSTPEEAEALLEQLRAASRSPRAEP